MKRLVHAFFHLFELWYSPPVAVLEVAFDLERRPHGAGDVLLEFGA
jgi:hypothetical protein